MKALFLDVIGVCQKGAQNVLAWGRLGRGSLFFLGGLGLLATVVPALSLWDPNAFNPLHIGEPLPPSFAHPFGTDDLGRDILVRSIYGARISLMVAFVSVGISLSIGLALGVVAGYVSGVVDALIMRAVDIFLAIPTIFLILTIQILLEPSIVNVMIVIGATSWMGIARLVRAEVLSIKERPFISAAHARGLPTWSIMLKHILPLTLTPVIVAVMLGMGNAILAESILSFLGLGVQPPHASWGNMLQDSLAYMTDAPWMTIIPGVLITLTVLALNFIGDDIRKSVNPRENV